MRCKIVNRHWITADDPDVPASNKDAINMQLEGDGTFFISYIDDVEKAEGNFGIKMTDSMPGPETAIVQRGTNMFGLNTYFKLQGDHREAYENLVDKGFEACYEYYEEHKQ